MRGTGDQYGNNPTGSILAVTMYKNDVGGLPDGTLDIWKTGVEWWGYTYNKNLSLYNGNYYMSRP